MSTFKNTNLDRYFGVRSEYADSSGHVRAHSAYINQRTFLFVFAALWVSIFAGGYIAPHIENIIGFKYWGTSANIFIIALMLVGYAAALVYYAFMLPERFQIFRNFFVLLPVLFFSLVAGGVLLVDLIAR